MKAYLFTSLAMNQTLFFEGLARELKQAGHETEIICFHERSSDYLTKKNVPNLNVFQKIREMPAIRDVESEYQEIVKKYFLPSSHLIFSHEMAAFELYDLDEIKKKFIGYSKVIGNRIQALKDQGHKVVMVQELGGFSSLLSTFFVSRALGLDHYFIEPAFFKGRYFMVKNSIQALGVYQLSNSQAESEFVQYLDSAIKNKKIVIPDKDRKHYWGLFAKVFNFYNFKRLFQKLGDRFIFNKQEEFRYIGTFTFRHIKMFWNKYRLGVFYSEIPDKKFIYYPLHVPMDVALTIRSPHCLDQYSIIDLICRTLPLGYQLVIKEHPAMVGVMHLGRMKDLLSRNANLTILRPNINNYDVLGKTDLVVTVNSKSGAEALLLNKRVLVMGDAFYSLSPLVKKVSELSQLDLEMKNILEQPAPEAEKIKRYFQAVWENSHEGEIYSLDKVVQKKFAQHIESLL